MGGLPGLWRLLYPQNSAEENLIRLLLQRNSFLPELMIKWLSEESRETAVYDTILAMLADGRHGKLNDMYAHTGFSRAKISVYLKNLMELELVEKVLGYDFEGYERTIDSHVKNLRAKIGDNPRSPKWLHTVHGVGYRFEDPTKVAQ